MTLVSPAELIALSKDGGVAAFNVITLEHLEAFAAAAEDSNIGVVLQISQNAARYHGSLGPIGTATLQRAQQSSVPFAVQLDHADDVELIREATELGFTSVMFDGSRMSYSDNVDATRSVTSELHRAGVWVEAELGEVGGKDGVHGSTVRTDPGEALHFTRATGVDGLAVAVGSSHAMTEKSARLDIQLIGSLRTVIPVPLVLHGSSGVDDQMVSQAVQAGISKVNFGTCFNAALTGAIRTRLNVQSNVIDPRLYLADGRKAMTKIAAELLVLMNESGHDLAVQ